MVEPLSQIAGWDFEVDLVLTKKLVRPTGIEPVA
jgi:hypothetical protein